MSVTIRAESWTVGGPPAWAPAGSASSPAPRPGRVCPAAERRGRQNAVSVPDTCRPGPHPDRTGSRCLLVSPAVGPPALAPAGRLSSRSRGSPHRQQSAEPGGHERTPAIGLRGPRPDDGRRNRAGSGPADGEMSRQAIRAHCPCPDDGLRGFNAGLTCKRDRHRPRPLALPGPWPVAEVANA